MGEMDPICAVTAANPSDAYERFVVDRPFVHDEALGAWVASSAQAVEAVLGSEAARVRPEAEPVPKAMQGTALGEIFGDLARMNDGPRHAVLRALVERRLRDWTPTAVGAAASAAARRLARAVADGDLDLDEYCFALTPLTVAALLGIEAPRVVRNAGDFARGFSPGASAEAIGAAVRAAEYLRSVYPEHGEAAANALGFFFQSYEATAALTGNALAAMIRDRESGRQVEHDPPDVDALLRETVEHDPPVHNTRRFAAVTLSVLGQHVARGEPILVVLAAANCDRTAKQTYTFGYGEHACPGSHVAIAIAKAGVLAAVEHDLLPAWETRVFRPSPNVRMPVFERRRPR
jgi:cytochrome P450